MTPLKTSLQPSLRLLPLESELELIWPLELARKNVQRGGEVRHRKNSGR
jgi:hypothetical protein